MDNLSKFSERLHELMLDAQLNTYSLNAAVGIPRQSIGNWIANRNKYLPTLKNLVKLADYFCCSLDFILGLENENYLKNPKPRPPFSERFRKAVENMGFNLYKVGKLTNMDTSQYYDWINAKSEPSIDSLVRIAAVLGCSIDYLVGR